MISLAGEYSWIDTHIHLWEFRRDEYPFVESYPNLQRDFLPEQFAETIETLSVKNAIAVCARQMEKENEWLEQVTTRSNCVVGYVGWVDLLAEDVVDVLRRFSASGNMKSVRMALQDRSSEFMSQMDFNMGISALQAFNLAYDLLIFPSQLTEVIELVDNHPEQIFVLNHGAKPDIASGQLEPWNVQITDLAQREHVYCKLSGFVTEAGEDWTESLLRPYMDTLINAFGPDRVMFGSDWPLCLSQCEYSRWFFLVRDIIQELSYEERQMISSDTARRAYSL